MPHQMKNLLRLCIAKEGWLVLHESEAYVKFTRRRGEVRLKTSGRSLQVHQHRIAGPLGVREGVER